MGAQQTRSIFLPQPRKNVMHIWCLLAHLLAYLVLQKGQCTLRDIILQKLGQFCVVPWTSYFLAGEEPEPRPLSEMDLSLPHPPAAAALFNRRIAPAIRHLRAAMLGARHPTMENFGAAVEGEVDLLFSGRLLDLLLGSELRARALAHPARLIVLNTREIQVFCPVTAFLARSGFALLPLKLKAESEFGASGPKVLVAALCPIYAAINHACDNNVATGRTLEEDINNALTGPLPLGPLETHPQPTMRWSRACTPSALLRRVTSCSRATSRRHCRARSDKVFSVTSTDSPVPASSVLSFEYLCLYYYQNWRWAGLQSVSV